MNNTAYYNWLEGWFEEYGYCIKGNAKKCHIDSSSFLLFSYNITNNVHFHCFIENHKDSVYITDIRYINNSREKIKSNKSVIVYPFSHYGIYARVYLHEKTVDSIKVLLNSYQFKKLIINYNNKFEEGKLIAVVHSQVKKNVYSILQGDKTSLFYNNLIKLLGLNMSDWEPRIEPWSFSDSR